MQASEQDQIDKAFRIFGGATRQLDRRLQRIETGIYGLFLIAFLVSLDWLFSGHRPVWVILYGVFIVGAVALYSRAAKWMGREE